MADLITILLSLFVLLITAFYFFYGLVNYRFSALFWLSLLAVYSFPAFFDALMGIPRQAFTGTAGARLVYAASGMEPAVRFAAGYVAVTGLVYTVVARYLRQNTSTILSTGKSWLKYSPSVSIILGVCFVISSAVILYQRWDLTRAFNDFLDPNTGASYENYFYLASTPLIAILYAKKGRSRYWAFGVAAMSVLVSYFLGVRYYMFPFIGYLVWILLLEARQPAVRKIAITVGIGMFAWIALTFWGIVRGLGVRDNPLSALLDGDTLKYYLGGSLSELLLLGNEFTTRLAYYDIVGRLQYSSLFRGFDAIEATLVSAIYPVILRIFGVSIPISNAKLIFEVQSGVLGSGVSSGTTVFGYDWFTWGWWGIIIGGVTMGILLALGDFLYWKKGTWWLLLGPMWTFQLIFFARGGTDVWLGIWGRFLPLSLAMIAMAYILDRFSERKSKRYRHGSINHQRHIST